jgi:hypothetical protein
VLRAVLGVEASNHDVEFGLLHATARPLVEAVVDRGAPLPITGWEVEADGDVWQVEAAWPERKVAVLIDEIADRDAWMATNGWNARLASAWTVSDLLSAVRGTD